VAISVWFNSVGGRVDVQSGRLILDNNGMSSNGVFTVATGASVDLTGGSSPTWSGRLTGSAPGPSN